ncbi:30S ribosomal protein S9 [Candidatus Saccharibacteria bacterium]|nr:30S ribosomal protein S9 [Candidatus Saccharibacteria bacterium]
MVDAKKYIYGLGRRKSATATARLYKGKGDITINGKKGLDYFSGNKTYMAEVTDPLAAAQKQKDYDITILVKGGGLAGQVDAIKLAISKALVLEAPDLRPVLKKAGLISRDPREKERKKYGLRSARKKEQFSKR